MSFHYVRDTPMSHETPVCMSIKLYSNIKQETIICPVCRMCGGLGRSSSYYAVAVDRSPPFQSNTAAACLEAAAPSFSDTCHSLGCLRLRWSCVPHDPAATSSTCATNRKGKPLPDSFFVYCTARLAKRCYVMYEGSQH